MTAVADTARLVHVYLPDDLLAELRRQARSLGLSLSEVIILRLEGKLW